ncbi:MarR family winged helix-turn-helix transcriptional regulator [Vibrio sp. HN007]|uniref:MarR family winged helix-turn-helix transcriptional regulator n=1 Tax=Vibrio iocasae TaxID=3098914 RepID=UPI0035D42814
MMKSLDNDCREQLGISVTQLSALMILGEKDNCLMKDLADTLMLDKSAITGLARRMSESGLIEKVKCSEDSRATRLKITKNGKKILNEGLVQLGSVNEDIAKGFTEEELDTVSRFLSHVTTTFSGKH